MKTLWNVVSFLAVVHLLALLIFVGWMWQTKRLTADRMHEVKEVLSMTVPEAQAAAAKTAADLEAETQKAADKERQENPSMDSTSQIQYFSLIKQQEEQSLRRLEDEKRVLMEQLAATTGQVDARRQELLKQRNEWDSAIKDDKKRKVDEQFLQTVKQYEQVTARQAKKMLMDLLADNHGEQAVAYLDVMNPRAASKILKEFKTDSEIALATELLEKLRTFGISPSAQTQPVTPPAATAKESPEATHANGLARAP